MSAPPGRQMTTLPDGKTVLVRPILPGDAANLIRFHAGLGADTVRRRFLGSVPVLSKAMADHFCRVDGVDRFALVALNDSVIIGVARMERIEPATAEVAFVVADGFQHEGLGTVLAQRLAAEARKRGVSVFVADTLSNNRPMLHLLPDAGYAIAVTHLHGVARVTSRISEGPETPPSAPAIT